MGSFTYTSINSKIHEVWMPNMLHPLKRKKRMNKIHTLSQKKKKSMKGELCNAMHKTTMESYLHLALALDP